MRSNLAEFLASELDGIKARGLYKRERVITSPQGAEIKSLNGNGNNGGKGKEVLNFCANNYLGLANDRSVIEAAKQGLDEHGFGMASVRFICGTQDIHKELEKKISEFLGMEDTILYPSCFDANGGLFEAILGEQDAVISDELNHASIIDGIRLCKAKRFRYKNNDMVDLESKLKEAEGCRFKLIATDGVFSMDGIIANLKGICDLADRYGAMVMVDDCHAVGFMGAQGRGTPEHCEVIGRIDIITGTLGKALGGASGGYTSGKREVIDWLRQRSRPYLFSNSVAPTIVAASLRVLDMLSGRNGRELRERIHKNAKLFRTGMEKAGFKLVPGEHPIVPVMLGDAALAGRFADLLLEEGIYVIGFSYPVVPEGKARIRVQLSAAHTEMEIVKAVDAFVKVKKKIDSEK
jgi:glycine C-acetyltransferase